ncbi:MAG: DUF6262 family protein [Cellulomonas sp.]
MTTPSLLNRVERACTDLRRDDQPITFTAVATHAGLSRSTLYRNPALRAVVEHHRRNTNDGTIRAITDEMTTLRTAVDALAARVRTHDEQLRRLTRN